MRMRLVFALLLAIWTILGVRIYYLTIKSNSYYEKIAEQNVEKTDLIAPVRGQILDIKGRPMAVNNLGFSIAIAPHLRGKSVLDETIKEIVSCFSEANVSKIKKNYIKEDSPYNQEFIKVLDFIPYDEMLPYYAPLSLKENIKILPASQRYYPYGDLASHVIGYVGKSNAKDVENDPLTKLTNYIGRSGVEGYYNSILQGIQGQRRYKVTALNKEVTEISNISPITHNIKLNIDFELQKYITQIIGDDAGAIIVMNLKDGAILAAGSFPEYELNPFVTGISFAKWDAIVKNLRHPFTNKLVNGLYPPGSIIKMGVGLAFLDSGKIKANTKILCDPYFELGGRKFRNWRSWGSERLTLPEAIKESCDTYFYRGAYDVGIKIISKVLERVGFGRKTSVDLPNEFVGIVPSPEWKKQKYGKPWFDGETLNTSIGQGNFLVTPMQIVKYTALLATGKEVTPHFLYSIDNNITNFPVNNNLLNKFEKSQLPFIRKGMWEVANVQGGTAYNALKDTIVPLAAKTGTAQVVGIPQSERKRMKEENMEYYSRSHAWITAYGPYANPQFAVTIIIEHGSHGGSAGGPLVKKIFQKLADLGYLKITKQ